MSEKTENLLRKPTMEADTCVCCTMEIEPKTDRKGRPFVKCGACGTMVFFGTDKGRIGYEITSKIIKKNTAQHNDLLESQYRKFLEEKIPLIPK